MTIAVMPNVDKFLENKDIIDHEIVSFKGKNYRKTWYVDNNGRYQYVYEHATDNLIAEYEEEC